MSYFCAADEPATAEPAAAEPAAAEPPAPTSEAAPAAEETKANDVELVEPSAAAAPLKPEPSFDDKVLVDDDSPPLDVEKDDDPPLEDGDAVITQGDRIFYYLENAMAVDGLLTFKALGLITGLAALIFGVLWMGTVPCVGSDAGGNDDDCNFGGTTKLNDAIYTAFEVIVSGGYNSDIQTVPLRIVFLANLFFGLVIFGIFVGFISDAVTGFMESLSEGKTKVTAKDFTLILGWNESTPRLVCQLAFLRRAWIQQNETFMRQYGLQAKVPPSTPVAKSPIVILCDKFEKAEMDDLLKSTMAERGINPKRTMVGRDVICRVGDPTNVHDLVRVGAHNATSVVLMMQDKDAFEAEESEGQVQNGGTMSGLLALRYVLTSADPATIQPALRVTVQMSEPSEYAEAAMFVSPRTSLPCVQLCDLSTLLNSLMFSCAGNPGLSKVILELINFDSSALRARDADTLKGGAHGAVGGLVGLTIGEAGNWWHNGLLVGVGSHIGDGGGFAASPSYVIKAKDRLLFSSRGSNPTPISETERKAFQAEADSLSGGKTLLPITMKHDDKRVLVCGWRAKWSQSTKSLRARISDLAKPMSQHETSLIVFMNLKESDEFAELMAEAGYAPVAGEEYTWEVGETGPGVRMKHVQGDATQSRDVKPVLDANRFASIVVLGTAAGLNLSPHSCDLRVISILLLLRHLLKDASHPVHIIGENAEDMTATLAKPPKLTKKQAAAGNTNVKPDFINTQAIIARALTQSLAFPKMTAAVNELFNDTPGTPNILVKPAFLYQVPVGTPMKFGTICAFIANVTGGADLCLGMFAGEGDMTLAPHSDAVHTFKDDDRVIILTKRIEELAKRD